MNKQASLSRFAGFLLLILFFAVTWLLGRFFFIDVDSYRQFLSKFPLLVSGGIFVFLYVLISFFVWIAKDIFKVIGALLFGAYLSALFVWIAELINATVLFNLARILGRDFIKETLKEAGSGLDKRIQRFGFWGIFSLRIIPLVPFRFLDLLAGLTGLRFRDYILAAALGSPLRIFWVQYILAAVGAGVLKDPGILSRYLLQNRFILVLSLLYLVAAVILAVVLKRKARADG